MHEHDETVPGADGGTDAMTTATDQSKYYGYTAEEWEHLIERGLEFLKERARLGRFTSYTEFAYAMLTKLARGDSGHPGFSEGHRHWVRTALGQISQRSLEADGVMATALVVHLNEDTPGEGFFALAAELGRLPADATANAKEDFWRGEVARVRRRYA